MVQMTETANERPSVADVDTKPASPHRFAHRLRPLAGLVALCAVLVLTGCAAPKTRTQIVYFPSNPGQARVVQLKSFNSLDEITPRPLTFAESVRGDRVVPFVGRPAGLAYANNRLFVCDTEYNSVHVWNLETGATEVLGDQSAFSEPVGVAVDQSGRSFIADSDGGVVRSFDEGGNSGRAYRPADREAYRPVAVATHAGRLYVADIAAHHIDAFDIDSGDLLFSFGGVGSEPGKLYFPTGVAVAGDGTLYVSDMFNGRVQHFSATGQPLDQIGQPGDRYGDLAKPRQLAVGPDGVVFVADSEFARIHLFDAQGRLLLLIGGSGDSAGSTPLPISVTVAVSVPNALRELVPPNFEPDYFIFTSSSLGTHRLSVFAVGRAR